MCSDYAVYLARFENTVILQATEIFLARAVQMQNDSTYCKPEEAKDV